MFCKKCKSEMILVGFERKLISRGKNKGQSTVKEYFKCCTCKRKDLTHA